MLPGSVEFTHTLFEDSAHVNTDTPSSLEEQQKQLGSNAALRAQAVAEGKAKAQAKATKKAAVQAMVKGDAGFGPGLWPKLAARLDQTTLVLWQWAKVKIYGQDQGHSACQWQGACKVQG